MPREIAQLERAVRDASIDDFERVGAKLLTLFGNVDLHKNGWLLSGVYRGAIASQRGCASESLSTCVKFGVATLDDAD